MTKYSNIALKWGLTDDRELYDWHREAVKGDVQRKNGSIVAARPRAARRSCAGTSSTPGRRSATARTSTPKGNDVAIETLELAHEGVERA